MESAINLLVRWRLLEELLPVIGLITFAWSTGVLFALAQAFQYRQLRGIPKRLEACRITIRSKRFDPQDRFDQVESKLNWLERFVKDDMRGIHYAVSIFVATTVLWILVKEVADENPIWAISSMVATSDPQMRQALATFRGRMINTLLGCATGLIFLAFGHTEWRLPFAMAATVLLSSYVVKIPNMWRQAPITAAIIIASGLQHHNTMTGMELGIHRVIEVLFGCVVGIAVAWSLSKVWPLHEEADALRKQGSP